MLLEMNRIAKKIEMIESMTYSIPFSETLTGTYISVVFNKKAIPLKKSTRPINKGFSSTLIGIK
jgi:hypothetical protein